MRRSLLTSLVALFLIAFFGVSQIFAQGAQPTSIDGGSRAPGCYGGYCGGFGAAGALGAAAGGLTGNPRNQEAQEAQQAAKTKGTVSLGDTITGEGKITDLLQVSVLQALLGGQISVDGNGTAYAKPGLVQEMNRGIAMMYNTPPASTQRYVADVMNSINIGIAQPAYAQGVGFAALDPILGAWKNFRNLAYLFFVFVFVIIGFLIMFRQKVGQSAITAQQAIPQMIIALLAVTFSYAIAGLLIDGMYIVMILIATIFGETEALNYSIFGLGKALVVEGFGDAQQAIATMTEDILAIPLLGEAAGFITGLTAGVIIAIAIAVAVFKLFFELVKTYVTIIITVVMAPLLLMMGAIPGRNTFGTWIKSLIGNLAVFPTILLVFVVYKQIAQGVEGAERGGFAPPFMTSGLAQADMIPFIVGLGLIMAMPELISKLKDSLGASKSPFADILTAGWGRARATATRIPDTQPIGISEGLPLRVSGKESTLERWLVGTRAERARELERQRQAAALGGNYPVRQGGLLGNIVNPRAGQNAAQQQRGGGAGSNIP